MLGLVETPHTYAAELQARVNRQTAELQAAQRRRDVEISQLREAQESLLKAASAIQSFVWYAEKRVGSGIPITTEEWQAARPVIEPAILAAHKLRVIAPTLSTETLRNAYIEVERMIFKVVAGGVEVWNESVKKENQPDPITRAVKATADGIKRLFETYPGELSAAPSSPQLPPKGQDRGITG